MRVISFFVLTACSLSTSSEPAPLTDITLLDTWCPIGDEASPCADHRVATEILGEEEASADVLTKCDPASAALDLLSDEDADGLAEEMLLGDGLLPSCQLAMDATVIAHHKPFECYGACGPGCGGCCANYEMYCPPIAWIKDGGWNATGNHPARCSPITYLATGSGSGVPAELDDIMVCGMSQMGFRVKPVAAATAARRPPRQTLLSIGSCPATDWARAVKTWTLGNGNILPGINANKPQKACSQQAGCFFHDECNRHDSKWDWLKCQAFGKNTVGAEAAFGTPNVPFGSGWWTAHGAWPLWGNTATSGGSPAPSTACFYRVKGTSTSYTVTFDHAAEPARYTDHPTQVQVACPIHNVLH